MTKGTKAIKNGHDSSVDSAVITSQEKRSSSHRLCSRPLQPAFSQSASTNSQKHYGKLDSLLKRLAPLALAGATLALTSNPAQALTLFAGYYASGNWTQSIEGNGSINTNGAPDSVSLTGANNAEDNDNLERNTDFTILAPSAGTVSFNWSYTTNDSDSSYDPFGYLLNGNFTPLANNNIGDQSSSESFFVNSGDRFGFRQNTPDSCCGSASTTISNFNGPTAAEVPVPLPLFGAALPFGFCRRLRSRSKRLRHGASSRLAS